MRTTIDINDHLLEKIRKKSLDEGLPLKAVINETLRLGLTVEEKPRQAAAFRCRTFSMGFPPKQEIDRALDLSEKLEDEEIARKLLLRK
jgi:hypothetical protein